MKKNNRTSAGIRKTKIIITLLIVINAYSPALWCFNSNPPKLTIVLVIDQFAQSYLNKLAPHFKFGLKYLLDHSVVYTNAIMENGQPGTATGHACLNTGVPAGAHGFIGNTWVQNGEKIKCDYDPSPESAVLSPNGVYDHGKSAHMLMVDGITDQCVLQSTPRSPFRSYSISLKSRSAIATASKLGKALWLDEKTGSFTSSKAYFDILPDWIQKFNKQQDLPNVKSVTWKRFYQKKPYAYTFSDTTNYDYVQQGESMINTSISVPDNTNSKTHYHLFMRTPHANQLLLDCALECIRTHTSRKDKNRLLLWVCLSPLDKLVHKYGPDSIEAIDMLYHLDKQLQKFIRKTLKVVGKHQVLLALSADHGIMPIPEILHEKGLTQAQRINEKDFIASINETIEKSHNISGLVTSYTNQELNINPSAFANLDRAKQFALKQDIKKAANAHPGIKNVWTFDELFHTYTQPNTIEDNIRKQLFPGRSGQIIIQPYPYTLVATSEYGTSHQTPYDYDTHVPLLIFHPGKFERRYVRQRVSTLQLANTIAETLNVPKPSASMAEILPELFDPEYE